MEKSRVVELEGQTSINDLLEDPVGAVHIQLALPIYVQYRPGCIRRLS